MPRQSNRLSDSLNVSEAELNPLLNPVLGDHMGLWAEVYFTSPPEQRQEAVAALLQELKAHSSERNSQPDDSANSAISPATRTNQSAADRGAPESCGENSIVYCASCGRRNPALHRFCGTCGLPLSAENSSGNIPTTGKEEPESPAKRETPQARSSEIEDIRSKLDPQRRAFEESAAHPSELSLFRSFREADSNEDPWDEPQNRRKPFYIGAVLAILIAGLAYMGWRSVQLTSKHSRGASQPPVATNDITQAAPVAAEPAQPVPQPPATKSERQRAASTPESAKVSAPETRAASQKSMTPAAVTSRAQTPIDNGSEELAVAQRYLNGSNGQARNSAEAARWLWKAISKQNGEATLMLADLYLKGDGVSKNCDQARVLLDSAGRKGVSGADTRLRNLQAFGCQ